MLRRALVVMLSVFSVLLPAMSEAYDIKPKTPNSAFAGKSRPDILGISADTTADAARAIFESSFKGRSDANTDIQRQKFGGTSVSYTATLNFGVPAGAKTGEVLVANF